MQNVLINTSLFLYASMDNITSDLDSPDRDDVIMNWIERNNDTGTITKFISPSANKILTIHENSDSSG